MPESTPLPRCLYDLDVDAWEDGLYLARCRFDPAQMLDDAFSRAGVTEPERLRRAVAKRRCEYLAGRVCATAAGAALTGDTLTPTLGDDRAPRWPAPLVGAITHSNGRAAALIGHRDRWQSLGLDHEAWLPPARAARLAGEILTGEEHQALDGLNDARRATRITLTFSVKESLFKALYPLTGQRFYFQDAALIDERRIRLLTTLSPAWPAGAVLPFQWREEGDGLLSWIQVPVRQPARP